MASLYHVKPCQLIKIPEEDNKTTCKMCKLTANPGKGIDLGALYEYGHPIVDPDGKDDVVVYCAHYFCLMFSSGLDQRGEDEDDGLMGFLPEDILREWRRGRQLRCSECGDKTASVGCSVKTCKYTFHLPCAIRSGSLTQFCDEFSVFCREHRPRQQVFKSKKQSLGKLSCGICYDTIKTKKHEDPLWGPCCNKFFHHQCVQQFATSSGYFFKCPMCNNKDEFEREMKLFGIYVPEKDASWEEGSMFEELYERHGTCDAKVCLCDEGREKDVDYSDWEIVLCRCCGAKGVHVKCGGLSLSNTKWTCDFCRDVVKNLPPTIVHSYKPINRRKSSVRSKMLDLLKKTTITVSGNSIKFDLPTMVVSNELINNYEVPDQVKVSSKEPEPEPQTVNKDVTPIKRKSSRRKEHIKIKIARDSSPPPSRIARAPSSPCIKRLTMKSPKMSPKKLRAAKQQSILSYFQLNQ